MKRKLLSMILAIVLVATTLPFAGVSSADSAADGESMTFGDFFYEMYDENSVIITDCVRYSKESVVPSHINGYPVVALGEKALEGVLAPEIILPDTLEIIGDFAFRDTEIKTLHIPENVREIGKGITEYCYNMTSFTVDKDNKHLKAVDDIIFSKDGKVLVAFPFMKNKNPEDTYTPSYGITYKVPQEVEYIGKGAFCRNPFLEYIVLPEGLKGIGEEAFQGCKYLRELRWPSSLEYIDYLAFAGCTNLLVLYGYDNFSFIAPNAFYNTLWYKNQPEGAIYLGRVLYSFKSTNTLNAGVIQEGTLRIEAYAFKYGAPYRLVVPESMMYIDPTAFFDGTNMKVIEVDENNPYYASVDDMLYDKEKKILISCPRGKGSAVIPDGTEIIYPEAFRGGRVYSVTIPESVYYIGESAFESCGSMNYVNFSEGVEYIGDNAFKNCLSIQEIKMPESVVHFGANVFEGCKNVLKVEIPEGSVLYNKNTFKDTYWYRQPNNRLIITNGCVFGYKGNIFKDTVMEIPDGVVTVSTLAFADMKYLSGVVLPDSIRTISYCAFENCPKLKEVTIPASVDEIYPFALGYTYVEGENGEEGEHFPVEGFVIKGYSNSQAEAYAIENGFEFVAIGEIEVSKLLGDTDLDEVVTIKDATAIQKYLASLQLFVTQQKINADMNSDGDVNIKDATAIQKQIAGLAY